MSTQLPPCPKCKSSYLNLDSALFICSECAYEWQEENQQKESTQIITEANGNRLDYGDLFTVIKDIKIKGSSQVVKVGVKRARISNQF